MKKLVLFVLLLSCPQLFAGESRIFSLLVGMQHLDYNAYSKYGLSFSAEATAGVPHDISKMQSLGIKNDHIVKTLLDKEATVGQITEQFKIIGQKIKKGDYFIFYFSGHGFIQPDNNGDEKSGYDQVLAAYDNFLVDDKIYELLVKYFSETNNIMIVDACHSASSYKMNGKKFRVKRERFKLLKDAKANILNREVFEGMDCISGIDEIIKEPFNLIYFGASEDSKTAKGGELGGLMTICMFDAIKKAEDNKNWNRYTYLKLACTLKERMQAEKQNLQYFEIGQSVKSYSEKVPFKIQQI